jgi:mannitol operon repressor
VSAVVLGGSITVIELSDFTERFEGESDRGAALISAALLDEGLRFLIASFLIEDVDAVDRLLGTEEYWDCPLGAFGARIRAAYCLGLVSEDEFHDLRIIQRIRNAFAHELDSSSFSDEQIRNRCNSLRIVQRRQWHPPLSSRDQFLYAIGALSISLRARTVQAQRQRRQVPQESGAF